MMNWESEICSSVLIWILRWWENVQCAFVVGYSGCPFTFSFSIYIFIMLLPRSPPCQLLPFPFYTCLSCSLNLNRGITSPDIWLQLFYFKFEGLGWTINWPNQYALFGKWISRDLGHTFTPPLYVTNSSWTCRVLSRSDWSCVSFWFWTSNHICRIFT